MKTPQDDIIQKLRAQAAVIKKLRAERREKFLCAGCGKSSFSYRCRACTERRRDAHRLYMRKWRESRAAGL